MKDAESEQVKEVKYPKIIALDNNQFHAVDFNEANDSENALSKLLSFHIGIGGFMPRYLSRRISDGDGKKFACMFLRQNGTFTKCDLVQLFFDEDCKLIDVEEVQELIIEPFPDIKVSNKQT